LVSETGVGFEDKNGVQHVDMTGPPSRYKQEGVAEVYMVSLAGWREVVVTDNHSSAEWANVLGRVAEEWFPQAIQITIMADKATFEPQVKDWVSQRNEQTSVVDWRFKSADARIKLKRLYPSELAG
jgi:hypothetical protein